MSQPNLKSILIGGTLALVFAGASTAQTLVIRATGPSAGTYPAGRPIAGGEINLQAGDQLIVIDGGATRTLQGPGKFTPGAASNAAARSNYTALVSQRTTRIARTGAARSPGGPVAPRSPNLWYVDIDKSTPVCLADFTAAPVLWRAEMIEPAVTTVTRGSDSKSATVNWAAGQSGVPWPEDLAPKAGDTFNIARAGAVAPTVVTFKAVTGVETAETTAAALIGAGCNAQLDVLVASLTTAES